MNQTTSEDTIVEPLSHSLITKPSRVFTDASVAESEPWVTVDTLGTVPTSLGEEDEEAAVVSVVVQLSYGPDDGFRLNPSFFYSQYDFFIEDDGQSLLAELDGEKFPRPLTISSRHRPPTVVSSRTRRSRLSRLRVFSTTSENSVDQYGSVILSLSQLCEVIDRHRSLQRAEIISTEGYVERLGAIIHRFLVLLLRRSGRKPVYLRLDRRLGKNTSALHLLRSSGSTPANDVVCLCAAPNTPHVKLSLLIRHSSQATRLTYWVTLGSKINKYLTRFRLSVSYVTFWVSFAKKYRRIRSGRYVIPVPSIRP